MAKQKMKNKKFCAIVIPLTTVALAAAIALPIVSDVFSVSLDTALGSGKLHTIEAEGTDSWDTDYYNKKYSKDSDAKAAAATTGKKIADEGLVLLKNTNSALPLASSTTITPLGYGYGNPAYGGSGSGNVKADDESIWTPEKALKKNFTINDSVANIVKNKENYSRVKEADGTSAAEQGAGGMFYNDFGLKSLETSKLDGVAGTINGTTAVVFISRSGGESFDIKKDAYSDGTAHYLTLSKNEKDTIKYAKDKGCTKVIAIINSSNAMQIDEITSGDYECDSILWVGGTGAAGFEAMSDALVGTVNPSGRLVDTYAKDMTKNPSFKNFGDYSYDNATFGDKNKKATYVQYEEGIYVGYKYYETAAEEGAITYSDEVVFPFGYGISYSTFNQKITSFEVSDGKVKVSVEVENTGSVAGKDVVQIYYKAPYTSYDKTNGVEKAAKNLVAFGKSDTIAAKGKGTVEIEFALEDCASYNYNRDNGDGTKGCYMLEEGEYTFYLGKNSHDSYESKTHIVSGSIFYDNKNPRQSEKDAQAILDDKTGKATGTPEKAYIDADAKFVAATNEFQESSNFMNETGIKNLTRADKFVGGVSSPTSADNTLAKKYLDAFDSLKVNGFNVDTNENIGNVETSKVYDNSEIKHVDSGLALSSLRGKSYYSSEWETLLDQINFDSATTQEELRDLLYYGAYNTAALTDLNKISTKDFDGPQGLSSFMASGNWYAYPSEVVVSATWNQDLVEEYGHSIGREGLASGISGWYGPAMNTHRSPFAGRNFEYYSEDGVLAGKIAASVVSGAADEGFYAYLKHFALNDQETNRTNYLCTWANEQAIREIYLKPFEICTKEARTTMYYTSDANGTKSSKVVRGTTGIMTAFNCIGTAMASSNYSLTTEVLRNEWGFQGMVITDFGPTVNYDAMVRSGNDYLLNANWGGPKPTLDKVFVDTTSNTARHAMRNAVKNICYTVVNSSAYNNIAPGSTSYRDMSPWRIGIYSASGVLAASTAAGLGFIIFRLIDAKKNPLKYSDEKKEN